MIAQHTAVQYVAELVLRDAGHIKTAAPLPQVSEASNNFLFSHAVNRETLASNNGIGPVMIAVGYLGPAAWQLPAAAAPAAEE